MRALGARSGPIAVVLCPSLAVTPALRAAQAALRLHRLARAADVFVSAHVELAGARTSEAAAPARERLASAEATLDYLAKRYPPQPDAYMRSALPRDGGLRLIVGSRPKRSRDGVGVRRQRQGPGVAYGPGFFATSRAVRR